MNAFRKNAAVLAVALSAAGAVLATPASADTDTTPPTVPQNLHQSAALSASQVISWDASIDTGSGLYHYWVLVDGQQHARPTATSYDLHELVLLGRVTAGPHVITVQAVDFALNRSAPSNPINVVIAP